MTTTALKCSCFEISVWDAGVVDCIGIHPAGASCRLQSHNMLVYQGIVVTAADIKSNCIALPYWAWEHDAGKTASGRAFSEPSTLGSSGWGQSGNCVADGLSKWTGVEADADWLIAGTPKCLKRSYNPAGTVNTFDLSQWASMLTISGYCSFANSAEGGIHYAPHTYVSGTMGSVSTAGREHLFYLHHNNIDRLWSEWQEYAPGNKFDYDDCGTSKGYVVMMLADLYRAMALSVWVVTCLCGWTHSARQLA